MNDVEYHDALTRHAERGRVAGPDAVLAGAQQRVTAGQTPRRSPTARRLAAAAAVVAVVAAGITIARSSSSDDQRVVTTPSPFPASHRYRVTFSVDPPRLTGPDGTPNPNGPVRDLVATAQARLDAYGISGATVAADSSRSIEVVVPETAPAASVGLLLGTTGRLAAEQLDTGPRPNETCDTTMLGGSVAFRSGTWPAWGRTSQCFGDLQSVPIEIAMHGRDPAAPRVMVPGATLERRSNGADVDLVVTFGNAFTGFGVRSCDQPTCSTFPSSGDVATFDGTSLNPPGMMGIPSSATFSSLSPSDADVLAAILLGGEYLAPVAVTDLDRPDHAIGTTPPGTAPETETTAAGNPSAPVVKRDVLPADASFCLRAADFVVSFGGNETDLEQPNHTLNAEEEAALEQHIRNWKLAVADLDQLAPPDLARTFQTLNAFVQQAPDRHAAAPDPVNIAETDTEHWMVTHCGFDLSGHQPSNSNVAPTPTTTLHR